VTLKTGCAKDAAVNAATKPRATKRKPRDIEFESSKRIKISLENKILGEIKLEFRLSCRRSSFLRSQ
jgi:hypothetical protein